MRTEDASQVSALTDFYVKMFAENMTMLRHHETQRSTSTTIFCSLAVLLLSVAAVFWEQVPILPVSIGLFILGLAGAALNMKLFERSAFHLNLALAYQQSVEMLLSDSAKGILDGLREGPNDPRPLPPYVRAALHHGHGFVRTGKNNRSTKSISFVKNGPSDEDKGILSLDDFDPVAPFKWVDPIHNRFLTFAGMHVARWDLYRIWIYIFAGFVLFGIIGIFVALSEPADPNPASSFVSNLVSRS